jgi:hypothetical protein
MASGVMCQASHAMAATTTALIDMPTLAGRRKIIMNASGKIIALSASSIMCLVYH